MPGKERIRLLLPEEHDSLFDGPSIDNGQCWRANRLDITYGSSFLFLEKPVHRQLLTEIAAFLRQSAPTRNWDSIDGTCLRS